MDLREFRPDPARELAREKAELRLILVDYRDAQRKMWMRGFVSRYEVEARIDAINAELSVAA